jgi:hypothetical protein
VKQRCGYEERHWDAKQTPSVPLILLQNDDRIAAPSDVDTSVIWHARSRELRKTVLVDLDETFFP